MTDLLFRGPNLSDVLDGQELSLANEIDSLDEGRVLNTSPEDLCDYFVEKYVVNALEIDESQIHMDYGDTKIDISHRIDYAVFDSSRPVYVTGTRDGLNKSVDCSSTHRKLSRADGLFRVSLGLPSTCPSRVMQNSLNVGHPHLASTHRVHRFSATNLCLFTIGPVKTLLTLRPSLNETGRT